MKEYIKTTYVTNCRSCPLRKSDGHEMYCGHPYFIENEPHNPYASLIVSHFTLDSFPIKCPLKAGHEIKSIEMIMLQTEPLILKTSKEWFRETKDLVIYDADGWDRSNFAYSFDEELITKDEFERRLMKSTTIQIKDFTN